MENNSHLHIVIKMYSFFIIFKIPNLQKMYLVSFNFFPGYWSYEKKL